MYKSFTCEDYKKHFSLPTEYKVDGFLSYGSWDEVRYINKLEQALEKSNIKYSLNVLKGFLSHILEIKINNKNYWFVVMYGGAMLSEYTHLACLFGSKRNIHIGSCGGLALKIKSLDLIIPTWSYGDESITRIYNNKEPLLNNHYPDKKLSKLLEEGVSEKFNLQKGPIITNQAMMGESIDDIKLWSEQGYYGVEMETSTIFSVSNYFNVPSAALLYVSDNLINGQTVGDKSHLKEKTNREKTEEYLFSVSLNVLLK